MTKTKQIIPAVLFGVLLFIILSILIVFGGCFIKEVLTYKKVYSGIYLEDINLSGLKVEDFQSFATSFNNDMSDKNITISFNGTERSYSYLELGYSNNTSDAINIAYQYGRSGNIFHRLIQIYAIATKNINIPLNMNSNKEILQNKINAFYDELNIEKLQHSYIVNKNTLFLYAGHMGITFNKEELFQKLLSLKNMNSTVIKIPVSNDITEPLVVNTILNFINQEAKEAILTVQNNIVEISNHRIGRFVKYPILVDALKKINISSDITITLPIEIDMPKLTKEQAEEMLFRDNLSNNITYFSTNTANSRGRGINIAQASKNIFGTILAPGDVFSFNDIVGKRTPDSGFVTAHIYVGGEIVDGIGGGICQVSTTLYNAVLFSGLEVVERNSHYFTVGYAPYGQDATVSYGTKDLKFRNNFDWPVLISGNVINNSVLFEILGTNLNPEIEIKIENKILQVIPFKRFTEETDTLLKGTTYLIQKGMNGYKVDTYKVTLENGKEISREYLYNSYYRPYNETLKIGTRVE